MHKLAIVLTFTATLLLAACGGGGGEDDKSTPTVTPAAATDLPAPDETATPGEPEAAVPNTSPSTAITLPEGFAAYAIAEGFSRATSVAVGSDGTTYVSERHGNIYRLVDADGDGVFDQNALFADGFNELTGLLVAGDGTVYASSRGKITTLRDTDGDGVADAQQDIISDLPVGRHQSDGMDFGPDGKLYFDTGSTCDECVEANPLSASIVQANADGSGLRVYARGLRNVYDLVWDGQGRLWATDNGSDEACATIDELNIITDGADYGWPYGAEGCDPLTDGVPPVASLGLHTASTGVDIYESSHFPAEYQGNIFTTLWGSLFAVPEPFGQALARVRIEDGPNGPTGTMEQFAGGFRHPIDVVVDRDGTLLVLDYGEEGTNPVGALYRIVYTP